MLQRNLGKDSNHWGVGDSEFKSLNSGIIIVCSVGMINQQVGIANQSADMTNQKTGMANQQVGIANQLLDTSSTSEQLFHFIQMEVYIESDYPY